MHDEIFFPYMCIPSELDTGSRNDVKYKRQIGDGLT